MATMTSNADTKSADNDPHDGVDEITSNLGFPERATEGAGPNQGAREG